jgi:hypothetical protein
MLKPVVLGVTEAAAKVLAEPRENVGVPEMLDRKRVMRAIATSPPVRVNVVARDPVSITAATQRLEIDPVASAVVLPEDC